MKVVPALLSTDETDYGRKLALVASFADFVQIDFMDGIFVPSHSVGAAAAAAVAVPIPWEAHLMVRDPLAWLRELAPLRPGRVIFHHEAVADPVATAIAIRGMGFAPAVALNPETEVEQAGSLLPAVDAVLVMSVNPGFYGSPFIPAVLAKVAAVKERRPGMTVGLDGGVGPDNLHLARAAGADYACVGSRIFQAEDPAGSYARLNDLAR